MPADSGPAIVLTGEADLSSITLLTEVLLAQISARTRHLTIDVTDLRSVDSTTAQALMLAALIVKVQGGSAVLLNPQQPVAHVLDHLRAAEVFTIQGWTPLRSIGHQHGRRLNESRPMSMTDHGNGPDWTLTLRRWPTSDRRGNPEGGSGKYEVICRQCGDDPALDYREATAEFRQIRGPYPLMPGVAAFLKHDEFHDRAKETEGQTPNAQ